MSEVPRDVEVDADDLDPRILSAVRMAAEAALNRMPLRPKVHIEGSGQLEMLCQILKWCAGIAALFIVCGITSLIVMYGNQRSIQTALQNDEVANQKLSEQVEKVYQMMLSAKGDK